MTNTFNGVGLVEVIVILLVAATAAIVIIWPTSRVLRRLGFPVWLAPLALVPLLNIGLLYFVAFAPKPERAFDRERS
ncbi:MAG TPA: hypothetical protein VF701_04940 [Thermoanaerobaculia bacterium]